MSEAKKTMKELRRDDCDNVMEQLVNAPCISGMIRAIYNRGWKDGAKAMNAGREEAYQAGLDKAWETAKMIVLPVEDGGLTQEQMDEVFGTDYYLCVMKDFTPSEAIQKIADWKMKKKQEELEAERKKEAKPHWKFDPENGVCCSECGAQAHVGKNAIWLKTPYCYNCGAKME